MNIVNIIQNLQNKLNTNSSLDLMTGSKIIERLRVGAVTTVDTVDDLPDVAEEYSIFYVESDQEFFYFRDGLFVSLIDLQVSAAIAWGGNFYGMLGDGTTISRNSPVKVIGGITNWKSISAGNGHTAAVTDDGIAYAWGDNFVGQLGDDTTTSRLSPVTDIGGITNWKSISAGGEHTAAVTDDGIAYAWGSNGYGQLGDGQSVFTPNASPVTVIGGITNWRQISAGSFHTAAVTDDGIAYAWGNNSLFGPGRLGDGTTTYRSSPVTVIGGITNWKSISASRNHTAAVTEDGVAYAWGAGSYGRLGDGTTTDRSSPVSVVGGITNWKSISAGGYHTAAVTDDGIAYAWGSNSYFGSPSGQLGDGTTDNRSSPVTVIGGITNWKSISAGGYHTTALTNDGLAYAWGNNSAGRLGNGDGLYGNRRSSPVTVIGGITNWSQISAGTQHTAAIAIVTKQI